MRFTFQEYFFAAAFAQLVLPLVFGGAVITSLVVLLCRKSKKILITLSVFLVLFLTAFFGFLPTMPRAVHLLCDFHEEECQITGTIDSIWRSPDAIRYAPAAAPDGDNYIFASLMEIGGEEYYILYSGTLAVGDEVTLGYLPKSKCVLWCSGGQADES